MMEGSPVLFNRVRTLETEPEPAAVVFRGGNIDSLEAQAARELPRAARAVLAESPEMVEGDGRWLLPGWVNLQVNDLEWLAGGHHSAEEHRVRLHQVLRHQAARGVTGLMLATSAAPEEEILTYLEGIAAVRQGGGLLGGVLLGALLEGTFMNPALSGAHNPAYIRIPERQIMDRFVDTGGVRMMNIAPEMSEDSLELIRHLVRRGVLVGCGHAKPGGMMARQAVEAGLSYIIHLGNGPTGSSLKVFNAGGLMEEALFNDSLTVSLILDGVHLDPRLVRDIIARKEVKRVVGISDSAFALEIPEGEFTVFGVRGRVDPDGRFIQVVPPPGTHPPNPRSSDTIPLFGSAAGMRAVFENILSWLSREMAGIYHRRHRALSLVDALRAAVDLTSANPARVLGESGRGRLAVNSRADAILASIDGVPGEYRVKVDAVWLAGEAVSNSADS